MLGRESEPQSERETMETEQCSPNSHELKLLERLVEKWDCYPTGFGNWRIASSDRSPLVVSNRTVKQLICRGWAVCTMDVSDRVVVTDAGREAYVYWTEADGET